MRRNGSGLDESARGLDPMEWLALASNHDDAAAAWTHAARRLGALGFETSGLAHDLRHDAPTIPSPESMFGTIVTPEWHEYYASHRELVPFDPFARALFRTEQPIFHSESCSQNFAIERHADRVVFDLVRDHGMSGTFGVSVRDRRRGTISVLIGASLSKNPEFIRSSRRHGHRIALALRYFLEGLTTPSALRPDERPALTPRERDCLLWAATGQSTQQIADALAISDRSVEGHLQAAIRKLGAANRTQACVRAIVIGLIEP